MSHGQSLDEWCPRFGPAPACEGSACQTVEGAAASFPADEAEKTLASPCIEPVPVGTLKSAVRIDF